MAMLFGLSSWETPPELPGQTDKGVHWALYCGLGALFVRALTRADLRDVTLRRAMLAVACSAAYGITDEFHQRFVPGRSAAVSDLIADTLGALAASMVLWAWSRMRRARPVEP
jgi:VanZ family protein